MDTLIWMFVWISLYFVHLWKTNIISIKPSLPLRSMLVHPLLWTWEVSLVSKNNEFIINWLVLNLLNSFAFWPYIARHYADFFFNSLKWRRTLSFPFYYLLWITAFQCTLSIHVSSFLCMWIKFKILVMKASYHLSY